MTDPVAEVARSAAVQLGADATPEIATAVEQALVARDVSPAKDQYFDPISLGSLIVSIATLVWTAYIDLRKKMPTPSREVLARTVRVKLQDADVQVDSAIRDRIVEVVVTETLRTEGSD